MKKKNFFLSFFIALLSLSSRLYSSYLFIDTEGNNKERYPLLNDSKQKEWIHWDYRPLASLLDKDLALTDYQGVFFIISNQFKQI